MSYQEKNTWAFGVIAVLGYGIYVAVVLGRADGGPLTEVAYAGPMLASIGAAVLAGIVAGIVLGAASPDRAVRDEREREIERLGEHVGQAFLVLGGLGGLALALLEADPFWIANVLYLGFVLSAVLSAVARLVAFRRGVGPW
ncbi:hypothetical protein CHO01_18220 [Cellulomonas hominis]|jgi:hypothetical protein|uniref:DUF2178 domain-containing protein n=1 Tax=Cellulomonas hominis TaxID=156981 RepID=A0A511FBR7_9CELL|nr:hypothetical protein [Cellulomonas hominis]MBB5473818.1 hypothetical protein [Cellulomonas hominis]NKY07446.1 hypothetical protein [Cellulomonas hominis]NKY11788.1 hypothetical protein [Cellulomonas hominis]GEL46706.1 hypothetical protein CHO01_18220 [Cellulomonas hominis]